MGFYSDLKILYHLALKPVRGKDHAARMESFYAGQADAYDDFRKRLLHGRQDLWNAIESPREATWVDMGGGTGANLDYFGDRIGQLKKVYVVDLSPSLLKIAQRRVEERGWTNIQPIEADATTFQPPEAPVDVVTFSYSLTMIPDWFAAIDNAIAMLKPGGVIGIVDFYVSRSIRRMGSGGIAGSHAASGRCGSPMTTSFRHRITCPICTSSSIPCTSKSIDRRCLTFP